MRHLAFSALRGKKAGHHVAVVRIAPGGRTILHTHDFSEFFVTVEGGGVHCWNGRRDRLEAGDLVFVRAADCHGFECGRTESLRLLNLALAPDWWESFEHLLATEAPAVVGANRRHLGPRETAECARVLHRLINCDRADPLGLIGAVAVLAGALRAPGEIVARDLRAELAEAPVWLAKLVAELEDLQVADRSIADWQKRSGRSPEHLARCCRKYLGCTLTEMVNRARLRRVKADLRVGEGKMTEVAFDAGFHNLGHFYRSFRRAEGFSPKRWALAQRNSATVP